MGLFTTLSGFPSYSTVTVTVNGMPATTLEGAVNTSVAWGVPQPSVNNVAAIAHSVATANRGFLDARQFCPAAARKL